MNSDRVSVNIVGLNIGDGAADLDINIAHRLSTLRDADMLCVIEHGELKEMGTHDVLIRQKGKYFELYRLQSDALKFIEMG